MLQILLGKDSTSSKNKLNVGEVSPIPEFIQCKIRRGDGVKSLTTLEEGEFKVCIDCCIKKAINLKRNSVLISLFFIHGLYNSWAKKKRERKKRSCLVVLHSLLLIFEN